MKIHQRKLREHILQQSWKYSVIWRWNVVTDSKMDD